jgi:LPXTG-motif cell wall-anchored protein
MLVSDLGQDTTNPWWNANSWWNKAAAMQVSPVVTCKMVGGCGTTPVSNMAVQMDRVKKIKDLLAARPSAPAAPPQVAASTGQETSMVVPILLGAGVLGLIGLYFVTRPAK